MRRLHNLGVGLKIITGDNPLTARRLGEMIGIPRPACSRALFFLSCPCSPARYS